MLNCPRCHQTVDSQAIACPYCKFPLKAFGHPGIPLYQAEGEEYLCNNCLYHLDDTCNFPQRPYAKDCTLFHDQSEPLVPHSTHDTNHHSWLQILKFWFSRYTILWLFMILILISFLLSF
ncbi:zinc ribbon domain-containing protein [Dapis sp. BLCC M126]|uniref:zinc ribbon domain-containing protein n=1 Tax=Dapis sp. BLCC M126 TaxID=3400189 RepID=UPI003CF1AFAA